jgi:hypothetical protein
LHTSHPRQHVPSSPSPSPSPVWFVWFVSTRFVNEIIKWLDYYQSNISKNLIKVQFPKCLCLIIKGIDNQVQEPNNQINQYPPKSLIGTPEVGRRSLTKCRSHRDVVSRNHPKQKRSHNFQLFPSPTRTPYAFSHFTRRDQLFITMVRSRTRNTLR